MTYYLRKREDGSQFITEAAPQDGEAEADQSVEASCWIEAKQKLGFDLTALQQLMLADRGIKAAA